MNKPVIIITGALTGIGRAAALAFAKQGAHVVVFGRREAEGKALESELQKQDAEALFVRADVSQEARSYSMSHRTNLSGKTALVTGASRGFRRAVRRQRARSVLSSAAAAAGHVQWKQRDPAVLSGRACRGRQSVRLLGHQRCHRLPDRGREVSTLGSVDG